MGRRRDTIEAMQRRRDSWAGEIGKNSEWSELAPEIVRQLDEEIAVLLGAVPLTDGMERRLRGLTADTVIDRENDRIEGDVGL